MSLKASLSYQPLISIILPVFNPPEPYFRSALQSVLDQTYSHWELCIADDASSLPYVRAVIEEYVHQNSRIKRVFRSENGHISACSNSALEIATGEFIALLDHDDLLTSDALEEVVRLLNQHPEADMIYSDEDKIDDHNQLREAAYKPDWCPDSFLSRMYTCHLGVYRRSLVNQIGGFRIGFEGSQDYDLVLRLTEKTDKIFHIPKILYHWRIHSASASLSQTAKPYAYQAATKALTEAMQRRNEGGRVIPLKDSPGYHSIRYKIDCYRRVSIIILTRDCGSILHQCLTSIFQNTSYPNYEVIVIDNGSVEAETQNILDYWKTQKSDQFKIYPLETPFNYSQLNNSGVSPTNSEYLIFLNNDTKVITSDWIEALVEQAQRPSIGAVTGLLLYPDKTIQHAGFVLSKNQISSSFYPGISKINDYDTFLQINLINNVSAVSGVCLACRRTVFQEVGGFDEALPLIYNDVDFCLKLINHGYRNIYLPHVRLYHQELKSWDVDLTASQRIQIQQSSTQLIKQRWSHILTSDPCSHPHFIQKFTTKKLEIPSVHQHQRIVSYPLVSVCVPTYNGEKYLAECLESILSQTYPHLEIIISDDNSRDRTLEIAQYFQSKFSGHFRILTHHQYGLAVNWNYCISQAQGKYIKFIFQDDILENTCIEELVNLAETEEKIGLVFSRRQMLVSPEAQSNQYCQEISVYAKDIDKHWLNLKSIQEGKELLAVPYLLNHPINKIGEPSTVLIRKSVFQNVGMFDPELYQLLDLEMWFRIMSQYKIGFINKSLSQFRIHPEQLSITNKLQGNSQRDIHRFYQKIVNSSYFECFDSKLKSQLTQTLTKTSGYQLIETQQPSPFQNMNFPKIDRNIEQKNRPFWSVMIPTYNGAKYLANTLNSLLSQAPNPEEMQIEVVDDCSPDQDIETLVKEIGGERISFYRQPRNLGLIGNWNDCIQRAKGEWVHILHQDDLILPEFYKKLRALIEQEAQASAAFCRHYYIDAEGKQHSISSLEQEKPGIIPNWIERISIMQRIQCPAIVVKRSVYETLGGFCLEAGSAADWEMWKRIAVNYSVVYEPQPLACYRLHSSSESSRLIKVGANITDILKAIEISQSYLPPDKVEILSNKAREHYAFYAVNTAKQMFGLKEEKIAIAQIQAALNCSQSQQVKDAIIQLFSSEKSAENDLKLNELLPVVTSLSEQYRQDYKNTTALHELIKIRQHLAEVWLNTSSEVLDKIYLGDGGKAHKILLKSGIKYELLTDAERQLVNQIKTVISQGFSHPQAIQYLLAGMLYCRADQLQVKFDHAPIPTWFADSYIEFMFETPPLFQELGEADHYAHYQSQWLDYIVKNLQQQPHSPVWHNIVKFFIKNSNFIPHYFANFNVKNIYTQRAEIIAFFLNIQGCQLNYQFPQRPVNRPKIRLGILSNHFTPQTETYFTLPVFEHLDRSQFEIILYAFHCNQHPLEQYCQSCADRLVKLPSRLSEQVELIRQDDLDILLLGTNVTAVVSSITQLVFHRLARIQTTIFSSPVTTGIKNIDYYISGQLSETKTIAQSHYRENLALLPETGFCFSYYAVEPSPAQINPTRETWGITDETVVLMSGANFYKIIPEIGETWAKILAAVPNSILVLYPFAPSWSRSYAVMPFIRRFQHTLQQYGVRQKRLVIIKSLPSRSDVKECLKCGDIYLDSYRHSGSNSLVDPLEVGLPTITMDGETLRSKHGSGMLRSLALNDLIVDSEDTYINLAVQLANNPQLRQQYCHKIKQKMQQNPSFLDSFSYSKKMESLFKKFFNTWKQNQQFPEIPLNTPIARRDYLSELVHYINLYALNPSEQDVIERLRQLRKAMAEYWLKISFEQLEEVYKGHMGSGYQVLLSRGIQHEPLIEAERQFVDELTQVATGLTHPNALNCLIAAMLYYVPGKMLVRDAEKRLPSWLIKDYKTVFENQQVLQKVEQTLAAAQVKTTPEILTAKTSTLTTQQFQNRLQGCLNLYHIDPSTQSVVEELRQIRRQLANFWLTVAETDLESVYQSSIGKCSQLFYKSEFISEPLTAAEQQIYHQLTTELNSRLNTQKLINYVLAVRFYSSLERLQIPELSALPSWLQAIN
ncbi:glycosyltransferase [Lyngbya aestuarii]|uniref:glycosyltransferase n=1 Tax=Lyngbya aestuarii TaxID=118322 RepID=UPI000417D02C|nr:glycosyltransferase [Lyngbya aestuarii]